jgi:hypothetical protein
MGYSKYNKEYQALYYKKNRERRLKKSNEYNEAQKRKLETDPEFRTWKLEERRIRQLNYRNDNPWVRENGAEYARNKFSNMKFNDHTAWLKYREKKNIQRRKGVFKKRSKKMDQNDETWHCEHEDCFCRENPSEDSFY